MPMAADGEGDAGALWVARSRSGAEVKTPRDSFDIHGFFSIFYTRSVTPDLVLRPLHAHSVFTLVAKECTHSAQHPV